MRSGDPGVEHLRRVLGGGDPAAAVLVSCAGSGGVAAVLAHVSGLPPGGRLVAVIPLEGATAPARLVSWVRAVVRRRRVELRARAAGLELEARLGVSPTLDHPQIVFDSRGAAGRYACANLLREPVRGLRARARRLLVAVGGVPISVGGIIVVARRP
jgi:hypothetical protein